LDYADGGVAHQDHPEQGVAQLAHRQDHHQQPAEQGVEPGEDVGPQNVGHAAIGPLGLSVDLPPLDACRDVRRRQPQLGGDRLGHGCWRAW
jgi:hypothetical protein